MHQRINTLLRSQTIFLNYKGACHLLYRLFSRYHLFSIFFNPRYVKKSSCINFRYLFLHNLFSKIRLFFFKAVGIHFNVLIQNQLDINNIKTQKKYKESSLDRQTDEQTDRLTHKQMDIQQRYTDRYIQTYALIVMQTDKQAGRQAC